MKIEASLEQKGNEFVAALTVNDIRDDRDVYIYILVLLASFYCHIISRWLHEISHSQKSFSCLRNFQLFTFLVRLSKKPALSCYDYSSLLNRSLGRNSSLS